LCTVIDGLWSGERWQKRLRAAGVHALVVEHAGETEAAWFRRHGGADKVVNVHSVTKSITGALTGLAGVAVIALGERSTIRSGLSWIGRPYTAVGRTSRFSRPRLLYGTMRAMRVLVLGRSRFLGRAVVDGAVRRGWAVAIFSRGNSGPALEAIDAIHGGRRNQAPRGGAGVYKLAGPLGRDAFVDLVNACVEATGSARTPVWTSVGRLREAGPKGWTQVPLWRTAPGTWQVDPARALGAGVAPRPFANTVAAWAWMRTGERPFDGVRAQLHGISHEVEQGLLATARGGES
jgi:hypothetical protein